MSVSLTPALPCPTTVSSTYTLSPLGYLKAIAHCAKYPASTVVGLLVGTTSPTNSQVLIEDAIPLLHHWTSLSMALEAGLQLVSAPPLRAGRAKRGPDVCFFHGMCAG